MAQIPRLVETTPLSQGVGEGLLRGYNLGQQINADYQSGQKAEAENEVRLQEQNLDGLSKFGQMNQMIKDVYDTTYKENEGTLGPEKAAEVAQQAAQQKYELAINNMRHIGISGEWMDSLPEKWDPQLYEVVGGTLADARAELLRQNSPSGLQQARIDAQREEEKRGREFTAGENEKNRQAQRENYNLRSASKTPTQGDTRTYKSGGYEITEQWNSETRKWEPLGKNSLGEGPQAKSKKEAVRYAQDRLDELHAERSRLIAENDKKKKGEKNTPTFEAALNGVNRRIGETKAELEALKNPDGGKKAGAGDRAYRVPKGTTHKGKAATDGLKMEAVIADAKAAVDRGADPEKVRARLKEMGIDPAKAGL